MPVEEDIKAEANRLGFLLCGITTPSPGKHQRVFEAWIAAGRHAGMAYLAAPRAREMRANPALILPEARSMLVLGMRYPDPRSAQSAQGGARGRVASYAWGDDYHDAIPARLNALLTWIGARLGVTPLARVYTDTGPLLERDHAQAAGLGWAGKNTNLIAPRHGSYFLLAVALLSLELQPDPPFSTDLCGACTRCIEACPTACILPDRTLDAGRCISYLTIENKGVVPPELRSRMGDWVFGCDVCQMVCPWNLRFSDPALGFDLRPREGAARPLLREELALTPQDFNRKFKGSAVQRAKRRGYLRNVAVAIGNAADPADVPALIQTLYHEPEALVRAHAAWALGQMDTPTAQEALVAASRNEIDEAVRAEIHAALGR